MRMRGLLLWILASQSEATSLARKRVGFGSSGFAHTENVTLAGGLLGQAEFRFHVDFRPFLSPQFFRLFAFKLLDRRRQPPPHGAF